MENFKLKKDKRLTLEKHKPLILNEFRGTHNCLAILADEGYLVATPLSKYTHLYF